MAAPLRPRSPPKQRNGQLDAEIREALDAQRKDRAYELVLCQLGPELYRFLFGVLHDRDATDDLYQDLALVVWRQLGDFEGRSSVRTWLYAVAHNLLRQRRRRYSQHNVGRLNTSSAERIRSPSSDSPSRQVLNHEVMNLLVQLQPMEREVLLLRSERGLSYAEIGEVLGVPEEAAKKRFQRARDRLRRLLTAEDELL